MTIPNLLSNFFYRNSRLLMLTISLIFVAGLSSYFVLPRMEDPKLVERGAIVHTIYPGADPTKVESLVTEKIEDVISEIEEIKELRSSSREGISTVAIELLDEVIDADRVWSRIRDKIDDISNDLPKDALTPNFEEMDFKAYAILVALRWDSEQPVNFAVLRRRALQLEDLLQAVNGTEKVNMIGAPDEEILVTLNADQLTALNLTVSQIAEQIQASDAKAASGQVRGDRDEMLIEVTGELDSLKRIGDIPIRYQSDGSFVPLSSISRIEKTIEDPPGSQAIVSGRRSIAIGGFVRTSYQIDRWSEDVENVLAEFEKNLPEDIGLDRIFSQNDYVSSRLTTLLTNLLLGSLAVFFVVFFLMGFRNAFVVSLALPLASMMVLFGMRIREIPIHQMSVTGMIIALGLLIDNAIVIVDEISMKMRRGVAAGEAVSKSVKHLFLPLFGSSLTTALAFGPIALMAGPAGEFVGSIAINVIMAIFSSFFLAMTVLPAIAAMISPFRRLPEEPLDAPARKFHWWTVGFSNKALSRAYNATLRFIFRRPIIGVSIGLILPVLGFIQARHLQEQFFPPADRDQLHIELELSPSASLSGTLATTEDMTKVLLAQQDIRRVDWFIGESAPAFYYNLIPRRSRVSQYAQAIVQLNTKSAQTALIHDLQDRLDEQFAHARVLVRQLEQGPPFDAPVEVRLFGPDLQTLRELGSDVRRVLAGTPNVVHMKSVIDEVLPKIKLNIDEKTARAAGFRLTEIARQLDALTEGTIGGSIVEATEQLPVRVRLENAARNNLDRIADLDFVNLSRDLETNDDIEYRGVPLSGIADIELNPDFGAITHFNGRRMNEIQVFIPAGVLPSTVLTDFQKRFDNSGIVMPQGYEISFGGEAAKRDEAIGNLMANVGVLLVLMLATLVLSFGSFRIAGIIGVVAILSVGLGMGALWLFGFPFGFMAIVGTMGLIGVAINDTIVVLAAIQGDSAARSGDREALRDVVNHSTRHIISTSLTTMAGFTPLILGGGGFWPPLAIAVAGGVGGATVLALIFVPSCYVLLMCRQSTVAV